MTNVNYFSKQGTLQGKISQLHLCKRGVKALFSFAKDGTLPNSGQNNRITLYF